MLKDYEYIGNWWFPNASEDRFPGTLKFAPGKRPILKLMSVAGNYSSKIIKNPDAIMSGPFPYSEIILGSCYDGKNFKDITLYDCCRTHTTLSLEKDASAISLCPSIVFVGTHFNKSEDIKFKRLGIHYSCLHQWLRRSKLKTESTILEVSKRNVPVIEVVLDEEYKVIIENLVSVSGMNSFEQKEVNIKEKSCLVLETSEEKSFLEEYQNTEHYIRLFLSLWISKPINALAIQGKTNNLTVDIHKPEEIVERSIFPPWELCGFDNICGRFDTYLNKWFEKVENLGDVYNLYFETLYKPQMDIRHIFRTYVSAIEAYHERTSGGNYKCRTRLTMLLDQFKDVVPSTLIHDRDQFENDIGITRTYLVHHKKELAKKAKAGKELYDICVILKTLLEICFLKELDMPREEIKDLVSKSRIRQ